MSDLSIETRDRIEQDASKWSENQYGHDDVNMDYLEGALHEAKKAQGLVDLLDEARLQIEYLHKKFGETGSGNNVLARIETALAKYKEVSNG
jgi:hypothetical protein